MTDSKDDSEEIAAALAAVYAFIGSGQAQLNEEEPEKTVSPWLKAGRFEGIGVGRVLSQSQLKGQSFTWRSAASRKWLSLSISLFVLGFCGSKPALALERIEYEAPTDNSDNTQSSNAAGWNPSLPVAPLMKDDAPGKSLSNRESSALSRPANANSPRSLPQQFGYDAGSADSSAHPRTSSSFPSDTAGSSPVSTRSIRLAGVSPLGALAPAPEPVKVETVGALSDPRSPIRVALSTASAEADFTLPDGAQLIEEGSNRLLAELPPQSQWHISLDSTGGMKRLSFSGKLANLPTSKVLLASNMSNVASAGYTRSFKSSMKGGFTSAPYVMDEPRPRFSLPVKTVDAPVSKKQSPYKPASYTTGAPAPNLPLTSDAAGKPVLPPPVVSGYIISTSNPNSVISFAGKTYRGSVLLKPRNGENNTYLVINQLDVEDYLLSVVPSEMPSSWSLNALKAQSIAARSYAYANLNKHKSEGYDLKSNTEDQVYLGVQTETEASNRAVAETSGQVLKHNGKVVTAFFHSAGGGHTEVSEHVYGGKIPYLKSVPDFDDQSPHFNWNRSVAVQVIEDNLKKQGRDIGGLLGIFPLERGQSQRVSNAMIAGTLQTIFVSGEELRRLLSLPSTVFNVGVGPDSYLVAGRGFGHGLGMSQWGAKYLSEQGYNAAQILSYYYKDVSVEQF